MNISEEALLTALRFVCRLNIEGKLTTVNGQLFGDKIYCDSVQLTYAADAPNVTATFDILRNGLIPLDNPDNIHGNSVCGYIHSKGKWWIIQFQLWFIDAASRTMDVPNVWLCRRNLTAAGACRRNNATFTNSVTYTMSKSMTGSEMPRNVRNNRD